MTLDEQGIISFMNERSFIKDHQTKERIVQASLAVFAEKGYHATTIQEIAHRAGIAVGTIYIHFSNKSDLFRTLIQYVLESIQSSIQNAIDKSWSRGAGCATSLRFPLTYLCKMGISSA